MKDFAVTLAWMVVFLAPAVMAFMLGLRAASSTKKKHQEPKDFYEVISKHGDILHNRNALIDLAHVMMDYFALSNQKARELGMDESPVAGMIRRGEVRGASDYYPCREFCMGKRFAAYLDPKKRIDITARVTFVVREIRAEKEA